MGKTDNWFPDYAVIGGVPGRAIAAARWFDGIVGVVIACLVVSMLTITLSVARADKLAPPSAYTIAIFLSSDFDGCYVPGVIRAIRQMATNEANAINRRGGIAGKPIKLRFFDDSDRAEITVKNMGLALEDPNLLAMIGVPSSTRGLAVFDKFGARIGTSGIPFITDISLNKMFAAYPNVFTMASAVDNELELIRTFLAARGLTRPAFIGLGGNLYTDALGNGLRDAGDGISVVVDQRPVVEKFKLTRSQSATIVRAIKAASPDVIILGLGSGPGAQLVEALDAADVATPAFIVYGRIARLLSRAPPTSGDRRAFYQFARDGVPNAYNERLRQRIWASREQNWIFDDVPARLSVAEWTARNCKVRTARPLTLLTDKNRRAIGRGAQYRDMLALVAQAGEDAQSGGTLADLRQLITRRIGSYEQHERVMQGWWQDWSFTPGRTSAADTLIIEEPIHARGLVLAPEQYVRVGKALKPRPVVYISVDLISISRIDTNDRSFDAEFYLSFRSRASDLDITSIEFTNAYRAQTGKTKLLTWRQIYAGRGDTGFPKDVKLYRVSGKFNFAPDLGRFPFDTQRLSISFQPSSAAQPFLIQPPVTVEHNSRFIIDGWQTRDRYVGADQDIIPTIGQNVGEKRFVPFYKFNYTWIVSRKATDYYLRVVVPLAFILLVTYFSVLLPHARFESTIAIQVTTLLSAIALFLALPKVDSDQATLSDKIFMATYALVSVMIGLTVLKDTRIIRRWPAVRMLFSVLQLVGFPIVSAGMFGYLVLVDKTAGDPLIYIVEQATNAVEWASATLGLL